MRSGLLLLLVVLALAALAALLWWRFKGSGHSAAPPAAALATRNHHSLRTFHYGPASTAPKISSTALDTEAGAALAQLLPEEDLASATPSPEESAAELAAITASSEHPAMDEKEAVDTLRPVSIRHAAGAVASLLDTLDDAPDTEPESVT